MGHPPQRTRTLLFYFVFFRMINIYWAKFSWNKISRQFFFGGLTSALTKYLSSYFVYTPLGIGTTVDFLVTDTSIKRTPRAGPCLYFLYLTLCKTDISLRRSQRCPSLRELNLYIIKTTSNILFEENRVHEKHNVQLIKLLYKCYKNAPITVLFTVLGRRRE